MLTGLPRPWRTAHAVVRAAACLLAVGYVAARAAVVPLTYDEVSSLRNYVAGQPGNLVDFAVATNHLLNSVLTRAACALLGDAPWALRLPNVMAAVGYIAAAAAFAARLRPPLVGTSAVVLLVSNPYVLDYMALARGYGLATALFFGAVWALVAWWEDPPAARSRLALALVLAGAAVAANFSTLPGFVALVVIAACRLAMSGRAAAAQRPLAAGPGARFTVAPVVGWLVVALVYSGLVFSRARMLADDVHVPTTLRISGLFEEELSAIHVYRADSTGRLRPLTRAGDTWTSGDARDLRTLRVSLSTFADRNLAGIDVTAGTHTYRRARDTPGPWRVDDFGRERVLVFTAPLDWHGGAAHSRLALAHAAAVTAALGLLGLALAALARGATRARLIAPAEAQLLVWATLGVATLLAAPLYLLLRDGQLFFGGTTGFVPDTFGSLVSGTLYGAGYHPQQRTIGLGAVGLALAALVALALAAARSAGRVTGPAVVVLGVIALAGLQAEALHRLLGAPYPMARTAVFLLPVLLTLPALAADAAAGLRRALAWPVRAVVVVVATAGVYHWARVGNVTSAHDWPADAAAVAMLEDAGRSAPPRPAATGRVRIGVDWMYYPVAHYYAERLALNGVRFDAVVLPGDGPPVDFVYVRPSSEFRVGELVQRYPASGAELRMTRPEPPG